MPSIGRGDGASMYCPAWCAGKDLLELGIMIDAIQIRVSRVFPKYRFEPWRLDIGRRTAARRSRGLLALRCLLKCDRRATRRLMRYSRSSCRIQRGKIRRLMRHRSAELSVIQLVSSGWRHYALRHHRDRYRLHALSKRHRLLRRALLRLWLPMRNLLIRVLGLRCAQLLSTGRLPGRLLRRECLLRLQPRLLSHDLLRLWLRRSLLPGIRFHSRLILISIGVVLLSVDVSLMKWYRRWCPLRHRNRHLRLRWHLLGWILLILLLLLSLLRGRRPR